MSKTARAHVAYKVSLAGVLLGMLVTLSILTKIGSAEQMSETSLSAPPTWGITGPALYQFQGGERSSVLSLLEGLGLTTTRATARWSDIQPTGPQQWNWRQLDKLCAFYKTVEAQPWMMITSGSAPWATDVSQLTPDNETTADCPPLQLPQREARITGREPL